ncbi:hypothetical protein [Streptococcus uberis]|uniref:hypothetical protein n=1 Tax=Streptococcus uberis TaxID=1349 RepID=UPI0012B62DA2|nr:hypothetical protein [Streptococcus uberis]MTB49228.1 hypothetical protein [Streptococcus uberis]
MFNNPILKFDVEAYPGSELQEHISYYLKLADQGMQLNHQGDKQSARNILKEIMRLLNEEYQYYSKSAYWIYESLHHIDYVEKLKRAYAKVVRPNSYDTLSSNLYDIQDYLSDIEIEDGSMYGNIKMNLIDSKLSELPKSDIASKEHVLLYLLKMFYESPTKSSAKKINSSLSLYRSYGYDKYIDFDLLQLKLK